MALDPNWTLMPEGTFAKDLDDYEYLESKESGNEVFRPNASEAKRVFLVNWDLHSDFVNDLTGFASIGPGSKINRILPDVHPEIDNFYCTEAEVRPLGPADRSDFDALDTTLAVVTAPYKPLDYAIASDEDVAQYAGITGDTPELHRFVTRKYQFAGEALTYEGDRFQWVTRTEKKELAIQPTVRVPSVTKQFIWRDVPSLTSNDFEVPTVTKIIDCLGKINSEHFDGHNIGCVLFVGCDVTMKTPKLNDDIFYWDITYTFLIRDNGTAADGNPHAGHNYKYDGKTGFRRWDLITQDGTGAGNTLYLSTDLNTLFTLS